MDSALAIALVIVDALLIVAIGAFIRRRRGRVLPFVLAVLAGIVTVWLAAMIVLLVTV